MSIAERFQKAALDVLMIYAQRIKNVVNNPDHPLEEAVTAKIRLLMHCIPKIPRITRRQWSRP